MTKLRSDLDADRQPDLIAEATARATPGHTHEVVCGMCGKRAFIDEQTFHQIERAAAYDPAGSPYTCADCEAEAGDLLVER